MASQPSSASPAFDRTGAARLSPSVARLRDRFGEADVTGAQLVGALLDDHRDYAPEHPRPLPLDLERGEPLPVAKWIARAADVFELAPTDVLHGRLLVVAVALLDLDLGGQLVSAGVLPRILDELRDAPPLAPESQRRWRILLADRPYPPPTAREEEEDDDDAPDPARTLADDERVATHADDPAVVDQLGRRPFATVVADRIRDVWAAQAARDGPGSFMVHLHGPWGSGKSSLLNFLARDLHDHARARGEPEPLVVEFNAWRHQRLRPPWWALIREIHEQSVRALARRDRLAAFRLRLRWRIWRARLDWLPVLVALLLLVLGVPLAWLGARAIGTEAGAELPLKLLATLLTLGAAAFALSRSLVFGSARAAETYADLRNDPLGPIVDLFERLVRATERRLVVFVDDLDRCDAEYVVELLEGIQTLFRTAPVTYVVAADRKWICSSFEARYGSFGKTIGEPGRPLGYLFLDKIFQVSAPVPRPLPALQQRYWETLLAGGDGARALDARLQAEEAHALDALDDAHTQDELERRIAAAGPQEEYAMRAAAARRITSPEAQRATQHRLRGFAPLLEPNPRAMKRLVNAYGLHQATHLLEGRSVPTDTLARWTIVELRWPLLADHLAARPQSATLVATPADAPRDLRALLADDHVRRVLLGGTPGDPPGALGAAEIREIVGRDATA